MKFRSRDEAVKALLVGHVDLRDVKDMHTLHFLRQLTKAGDATFVDGMYATTWGRTR